MRVQRRHEEVAPGLELARRRSYSAMLSASKQASAACCATVLGQMNRFCASAR
jgi:hypothetical protein